MPIAGSSGHSPGTTLVVSVPLPATTTLDMSSPMCSAKDAVGTTCHRNARRFARLRAVKKSRRSVGSSSPRSCACATGSSYDGDRGRVQDTARHGEDVRWDHLGRGEPRTRAAPRDLQRPGHHQWQQSELLAEGAPTPAVEDRCAGTICEPAEQVSAAEVATPALPSWLQHHAPLVGEDGASLLVVSHRAKGAEREGAGICGSSLGAGSRGSDETAGSIGRAPAPRVQSGAVTDPTPGPQTTRRSLLRRLLGESAIYGLGGMANNAFAIILVPIYARALGREDYGTVALLTAMVTIATLVATLALPQAFFRSYLKEADDERQRRAVLRTTTGLRLVASLAAFMLLLLLAVPLAGLVLGDRTLWPLTAGIAVIVLFDTLMGVPLSYLRAERRPRQYAVLSFARALLGSLLIVGFVVFGGLGPFGVILGSATSALVTAGAGFGLMAIEGRIGIAFDRGLVRHMLAFSLPLVPASLAAWLLNLSDRFLVNAFDGRGAVGVYSAGYAVGLAINALAIVPFTLAWGAAYWDIARRDDAKVVDQPRPHRLHRRRLPCGTRAVGARDGRVPDPAHAGVRGGPIRDTVHGVRVRRVRHLHGGHDGAQPREPHSPIAAHHVRRGGRQRRHQPRPHPRDRAARRRDLDNRGLRRSGDSRWPLVATRVPGAAGSSDVSWA